MLSFESLLPHPVPFRRHIRNFQQSRNLSMALIKALGSRQHWRSRRVRLCGLTNKVTGLRVARQLALNKDDHERKTTASQVDSLVRRPRS